MSFAAAKATISAELLNRLDAIADGKAPVADLAQIKFSAQKLRNVAREEYLMVLAIAAALEGDAAGSDALFETAFAEFGYTHPLALNAFMCMLETGRMKDGLELLKRCALDFRDVEALERSLSIFGGAGLYTYAKQVADILDRMTGRDYSSTLQNADKSMPEIGVHEADLTDAYDRLRALMRDRGYARLSTTFHYDNSLENGTALVVRVDLPETAEAIFAIENEINGSLLAAGLPAVERGAFAWYFAPDKEAPRARDMG